MDIKELSEHPCLLPEAILYFWNSWGDETNFNFYENCIENSFDKNNRLPKFYVAVENEQIIGSYALLTNDVISRQDLMPWFACLFVNEDRRNQGLATKLLDHGLQEAKSKGYKTLYLSTDLDGFYEKNGWKYKCPGYGVSGNDIKIYYKKTA